MPGASPETSILTVWSDAESVVCVPAAAIEVNSASAAISQRAETGSPTPEPGVAASSGVTRVHRITPVGSGSPEATPCRKAGPVAPARPEVTSSADAATTVPPLIAVRRSRAAKGAILERATTHDIPCGRTESRGNA